MFRFEDQNKPSFNMGAPTAEPKLSLTEDELHDVTYGAMLSGEDPVAKYKQTMEEYAQTGQSEYINSLKEQINMDTNIIRRNTIVKAIEDPALPAEMKQAAIKEYYETNQLSPQLKEVYSEYIAAQYPKANTNLNDFVEGFFQKEVAAEAIDKDLNNFAKDLSGSSWEVFAEVAPWLAPLIALNPYTMALPIAADLRSGYLATRVANATKNKDSSVLSDIWTTLFKGEAFEGTRQYFKSLPPNEKRDAVRRMLAAVKELPAYDVEKYKLVQSMYEAEDYTLLDRALDNSMLLLDSTIGLMGKSTKATKVSPKSPLGRTATHNPTVASTVAGSALVDETGEIAKAFGETHASIVGQILPKVNQEMIDGLSVEASKEFIKIISGVDEVGQEAATLAARNELLYPPELKDKVISTIYDSLSSTKSATVHLGKSGVSSIDELGEQGDMAFKGVVTLGKTSDSSFTNYEEALLAAKTYAKENGVEGVISIVKMDETGKLVPATVPKDPTGVWVGQGARPKTPPAQGEYYLQHQWNHTYNPMDLALLGEDAIKINFSFLGRDWKLLSRAATAMARGPLGRYLFAGNMMPERVMGAASTAIDRTASLEQGFVQKLNKYVADSSVAVKGHVFDFIIDGERQSKIFTYDEITQKLRAQGVPKKDIEKVAEGYFVYRQVADWQYSALNAITRRRMVADKVRSFEIEGKQIYGKEATEISGVDAVWDIRTNSIRTLGKGELAEATAKGGALIKLHDPIRQGDDIANFVLSANKPLGGDLPGFVLPYIKGYAPRFNDNAYFLVRTPKGLMVDGKKVTEGFDNFRTTHAAGDEKALLDAKAVELNQKDPTGFYEVKRDRMEEKNILSEAKIYRQNVMQSKHRGEEELFGATREDPLVSLHKLVKSVANLRAMDEFMDAYRKSYVAKYGMFTGHTFPKSRAAIGARPNMTIEESKKLKEAFVAFDYLDSLLLSARYDQVAWQQGMNAIGEVIEPVSMGMAKAVKFAGKELYPIELVRRLTTHMMISLNTIAQRVVQGSALLAMPAIDSTLWNPKNFVNFSRQTLLFKYGLNAWKSDSLAMRGMPDDLIIKASAKMSGLPEQEYKQILTELKESGLVASVDRNIIIEGVFDHSHKALKEEALPKAGRMLQTGVQAIPAIGRKLGFDSGEADNLIGTYLVARRRFIKNNPGIEVGSPYFKAKVHADAREMSWGMNRAGAFSYQNNILALPLQFITAPHKAVLSLTTSKVFTAAEKGKLFGMYLAMYGGAGAGLGAAITAMREEYGEDLSPEGWTLLQGGLVDWGINALINMLWDEKDEHTHLVLSQRFSPISGGISGTAMGVLLEGISEDTISKLFFGPSWSLLNEKSGKLTVAIRDMAALYKTEKVTMDNFDEYLREAAEITTGGTNWMKMRVAYNSGILLATNGYPIDKHATRMEALGKLFGVQTAMEVESRLIGEKIRGTEKDYKEAGKYIYESFVRGSRVKDVKDPNYIAKINKKMSAYLSLEQDPMIQRAVIDASKELNTRALKDQGEHIQTNMYNSAWNKTKEDNVALSNLLRSSPKPQLNDLADNLNKITGHPENF